MSNTLYAEAIEAAEQIKLSTEEKVKQQIIESIAPQVRLMVEKKLFEDVSSSNTEISEASNDNLVNESKSEECNVELNSESRRILSKLISKSSKKESALNKIENLSESLKSLQKAIILAENSRNPDASKRRITLLYKNLVNEISNLKTNSIIRSNRDVLKEFYKLNKELDNMSKRQSNNRFLNESLESLLEMDLFEAEEGEEESGESSFLDDIEMDDEGESQDAPESKEEDMEDSEEEDMEDSEEEDMEDSEEDMTLTKDTTVEDLARMAGILEDDEDSVELASEGLFETMEDSKRDDELEDEAGDEEMSPVQDVYTESSSHDRILEIDENMLRSEIGKMKAIREGEAKDMASHFGGGSMEGEMFVDGVELNKLHEMKTKAAKVVRKNRMLESKLSQYKKALQGMKDQLSEMNLFNAKLLYANKLMQNRELSMKQQRHIVESLDDAKTIGEAKILFESLSKSLVSSRTTSGRNLSEGAIRKPSGSSSTPVRSGQAKPLTESVALDRWATLAGIR